MTDSILFEQPLNERIRTLLRLEFLFKRVESALSVESEMHHRDAVDAMLSMLSVFERGDMKQELMKEVERLISNLSALSHMAGVDSQALDAVLGQLDQTLDALHMHKSGIGQSLRENDFLYAIRQRSSIPGGTCAFDLPAFHYWLQHTPAAQRTEQCLAWLNQFVSVRSAVDISLHLIRESTAFESTVAESGFYQRSLDTHQPFQLIQVRVPKDCGFFPEISGGKHRFTVRFMTFDLEQRPQQTDQNVAFELSCCAM